jgi:hypothetical protein
MMHDESLHTPPALQVLEHWYVLNVYQLLCLSVVKFTLHPSPSILKEAQSKKTVDIMLELTPLAYSKQSKQHPQLEAVCTVATQRKDLA